MKSDTFAVKCHLFHDLYFALHNFFSWFVRFKLWDDGILDGNKLDFLIKKMIFIGIKLNLYQEVEDFMRNLKTFVKKYLKNKLNEKNTKFNEKKLRNWEF